MKYDLIQATRDFIRMGNLLKKLNNTLIVLVPKVPDPKLITDFCPISLCNMIYKIFSKVVVNRIKPLLNRCISPLQRGFVSGRQILDAVITTHDTIHSMEKSRIPGMAFKLDISKAYDKVNWNFPYVVLSKLGF